LGRHLRCAIRLRAQRSDYVALKQYIRFRSASSPQVIEYPLRVISGHFISQTQCPLCSRKRTLPGDSLMSAKKNELTEIFPCGPVENRYFVNQRLTENLRRPPVGNRTDQRHSVGDVVTAEANDLSAFQLIFSAPDLCVRSGTAGAGFSCLGLWTLFADMYIFLWCLVP
jgi:hypothetical protein